MGSTAPPARIRVPEVMQGPFTGMVIGTFGASLGFAENELFRHLNHSTVAKVILADAPQLAEFVADAPRLRRLNRSYVAAGVRSPRAHHPKYVLLVGPKHGRLLVGSGNLSIDGYTGPGECFTSYEYRAPDHGEDQSVTARSTLPAFGAVRELITATIEMDGWTDLIAAERVRDVFSVAPWLPEAGGEPSPVVHNVHEPLLKQFVNRIAGRHVVHLLAAAPFHDHDAFAVDQLLRLLAPERFTLFVQEGQTRLDVDAVNGVLAKHGTNTEIVVVRAPNPYPNVLLHAKFVVAQLQESEVVLQGSANLSRPALCQTFDMGNVEVANLLEGPLGAFGNLSESLDVVQRSDGLDGFTPDTDWTTDPRDLAADGSPRGVTWLAPVLAGELPAEAEQLLGVAVEGSTLNPINEEWQASDGALTFRFTFGEDGAATIDAANGITMTTPDGKAWKVYPYHLRILSRLSASGYRTDLLHDLADLNLNDPEAEALIAELDRVLIIDGLSYWRLAHGDAPPPPAEGGSDGPSIPYDELPWDVIAQQPARNQYNRLIGQGVHAQSDLAVILTELASRFRSEVRQGHDGPSPAKEPDGLGAEAASIEIDVDAADRPDDDLDGIEEASKRAIAVQQRIRSHWRRFITRFVRALGDQGFVEHSGSPVIVATYAVFNKLCRHLHNSGSLVATVAIDCQIRMWSFMWGSADRPGYLASLPAGERLAALTILESSDDLAVTLSALDASWSDSFLHDDQVIPLRNTMRSMLENEDWRPDVKAVVDAAATRVSATQTDAAGLLAHLGQLAAYSKADERDDEISKALGVHQVEWSTEQVMRSGRACNVAVVLCDSDAVTPYGASAAMAVWADFEPDRRYFRISSNNAVAVVDLDDPGAGFFFSRSDETTLRLDLGTPFEHLWERRLVALSMSVAEAVGAASS